MDFDVISNSFKKALDVWKENIVAYIVGMLIISLVSGIIAGGILGFGGLSFITAIATGSTAGLGLGLAAMGLGSIILFLVVSPLSFGLFYMAIKGTRGEKVEIMDIFYAFKSLSMYIRVLILFIVLGLIYGILSLIPILGWILMIVVSILLTYACYIYVMKPSENIVYALKESFNIVKDNLVMTIVAILVVAVLNFIGSIPFGLGLLITTPIAMVFVAYVLKELKPELKDES
jgi:Protein of unknown function (DUF975).